MSAYRWRHGGFYFPPSPSTPLDPRFHGYQNHHSYDNTSYFCAIPPQQQHTNLIPLQPPNNGFYSPQNSLYGTSQDNHWTGQVQQFPRYPVQHVHCASFPRYPNHTYTPFVGQTSHSKPSKLNPQVQVRQIPSSTSKKVESSESKQGPDNALHTRATPIAVNPPAKESTQWPKPDIELVVKDLSNPINEPFSRKRKRNNKKNKKKKVKKEPSSELMHCYKKHMVRDPWFNLKPVVGIIAKKWAINTVIENKEKSEGTVKIDYSKMSLADCLDMTFEETQWYSTVIVD